MAIARSLQTVQYYQRILATDPIAYWMLDEKQGTTAWDQVTLRGAAVARHGAHTGVTLYQPGIGDGRTSPFYDGANDFTDVYTVSFRDAFALHNDPTGLLDESEGTVMVWAKVANVGIWTDGNTHEIVRLGVDGQNYVRLFKAIANNRIGLFYEAGNVLVLEQFDGLTTTDWMCLVVTWSKSTGPTGEVRYYLDGVQQGATDVNLGVWIGNLGNTTTVIGAANTVPVSPWHGWLSHCPVWGRALSPATVAGLAIRE